jgi:uncharacterized RDD family membrane protein YckC
MLTLTAAARARVARMLEEAGTPHGGLRVVAAPGSDGGEDGPTDAAGNDVTPAAAPATEEVVRDAGGGLRLFLRPAAAAALAGGHLALEGDELVLTPAPAAAPGPAAVEYAGVGRRLAAGCVDLVLVAATFVLLSALLSALFAALGPLRGGESGDPADPTASAGFFFGGLTWWVLLTLLMLLAGPALFAVLYAAYSAALEGGPSQATLGKRLLGLRTTDRRGVPLSRGRAFARSLVFWVVVGLLAVGLSVAVYAAGLAMVGGPRAGPGYAQGPAVLAWFVLFLLAPVLPAVPLATVWLTPRRQAVHDLVTAALVVRAARRRSRSGRS